MRLTDPTHGSTSGAQCYSVCQKAFRQLHLSVAHLVRDEGVAGSNPATPTSFPTEDRLTGNDMGDETRLPWFCYELATVFRARAVRDEHLTVDQEVGGSNPPSCTSKINSLV
jgi:hypothetical protein